MCGSGMFRMLHLENMSCLAPGFQDNIETNGINKSQLLLLQGLTKLRQIANHPKMVDPEYSGDSGKLWDVTHMLDNAIREDHKILIFSQFVKHLSILSDYLKEQNIDFAYLVQGSLKQC